MFEIFTESARKVIINAKEEAEKLMQPAIDTEHLLLGMMRESSGNHIDVFNRFSLDTTDIIRFIRSQSEEGNIFIFGGSIPFSHSAKLVLEYSLEEAKSLKQEYVNTEHILLAILREGKGRAATALHRYGFDYTTVREIISKSGSGATTKTDHKRATPSIDEFGKNLTKLAQERKIDPVIGREKELDRLIQILSRRSKNNAILLGDPGVGKTAIAEALAMKLLDDDTPSFLKNKRIISLELGSIVAGTKYRGQFEERLKNLLREIELDKNIILFIDEIHTMVGAGAAEGSIDAANILKPALARGTVQCIGATTVKEYRKHFEKDSALERRFQTILVGEPTTEETIDILKGVRKYYEDYHKVFIPDEAIEEAVYLTDRYINDRFQPDKSIDVIDEASAKIKLKHNTMPDDIKKLKSKVAVTRKQREKYIPLNDQEMIAKYSRQIDKLSNQYNDKVAVWNEELDSNWPTLTPEDVCMTISLITSIPTERLKSDDKKRLANIDKELKRFIIGQDEAVEIVSKSVKRSFAGVSNPNKPMGSFIFLGPTGVGKTEVAKKLAEIVFGSKENLIKVDMSEYHEKFNVSRLIGSPPGYVGYDEGGSLTEQVRRKPYSVILFDEIEKAHPDVINIFLQILDEGVLTDGQGHKVNFKNTIIIMTSNLGTKIGSDEKFLGFNSKEINREIIDYDSFVKNAKKELKSFFSMEFINRVDNVVYFRPLTDEDLISIMDLQIEEINKRLERSNKKLHIDKETKLFLISNNYPYRFGARPIKRILQEHIEDKMSDLLLNDDMKDKKIFKALLIDDEVVIQ